MFIQKGWHIHFGREPQIGNTQKRTQRAVDGTWTKGTMRASCLPEPWPNLSMARNPQTAQPTDPTATRKNRYWAYPLHLDSMSDGMKPRLSGGVLVTRLWNRICSTVLVWSFIILELFIFTHKTGKLEIKGTLHNAIEASHDQLWSNWNEGGISSPVRNSESQHFRLLLTPSVASPFHL